MCAICPLLQYDACFFIQCQFFNSTQPFVRCLLFNSKTNNHVCEHTCIRLHVCSLLKDLSWVSLDIYHAIIIQIGIRWVIYSFIY